MSLANFHPAVSQWFRRAFYEPTPAQREAWPAIKQKKHVLIAAPTGSGKTLAAFLSAIDDLVQQGLKGPLPDETQVLYISPLKALSNDIQKNLQAPLCGIADCLNEQGLASAEIHAQVRTGDTPQGEREKMRKTPPHILVTTPESLFILLTSEGGRQILSTVRSVIVDEIHAVIGNKRGAHLSLSLERLQALVSQPLVRIGLSATQKPIGLVKDFLVGNRAEECLLVDSGHQRDRDLAIEVTGSPLEALMSNEVWEEVYNRLTELVESHTTTLIFVNNRRFCERATRCLAERLGEEHVAAHHGSLAREHRLDAEQRLKRGELKALVATASLELGIDIGDVDLVCQLGSPRSIAAFLQRVGRAGHAVGATPKGRLFPNSRDDLVECSALLWAAQSGEMDILWVPKGPLDVLSQQVIGEVASREWSEQLLYQQLIKAYPYRALSFEQFEQVLDMLAEGFATRRGRRSAYLYRDQVNGELRARKNARLTAITNAGAIPDQFDYDVMLEPQGQKVGNLNEDFSIESMPGDIFQLGNTSYRILKIENGIVRVEDAQGLPPSIPFWLGEGLGRSNELSQMVSRLRQTISEKLDELGLDYTIEWVVKNWKIAGQAAVQLVEYLAAAKAALQGIPTQKDIFFERFFDQAGDQHIVIHSPYGSRLNRAWGIALRKKFCRYFNFELQAAALEDSIVISLGETHSFPLEEVTRYLNASSVNHTVTQAILQAPLFPTRWRWTASTALAVKRNQAGKRVPAPFQRSAAEDLVAVVFPDQIACQDNIVGEREIPEHPLIEQTLYDCLHEAMDIDGLENLLQKLEAKEIAIHCRDLVSPSPFAQEILTAKPYAFLDDAPAEERRTRAVVANRYLDVESAKDLGKLDGAAIAQVKTEAWPTASSDDEVHDALLMLGYISEEEATENHWQAPLKKLAKGQRATTITVEQNRLWVSAERLPLMQAIHPDSTAQPSIAAVGSASRQTWTRESATVELLRCRLQGSGPISEQGLAASLAINQDDAHLALLALEQEGYAMQGHFSQTQVTEWCERGLLARIHRYTLKSLRQQIKPVSAASLMQFLLAWHGLGKDRPQGERALANVLLQLEGFTVPAGAWESDILPARIKDYQSSDLDRLCMSGEFTWLRVPHKKPSKSGSRNLVKNTPIAIISRQQLRAWSSSADTDNNEVLEISSAASQLLSTLKNHGASFFSDLQQQSGLLKTQVESALGELVANGLISADSFAGLRALTKPAKKKNEMAKRIKQRRLSSLMNTIDNAGRWSLVHKPAPEAEAEPVKGWFSRDYESLETIADTLLHRYGIVFRKLLERESNLPPWRELLYVFRRLEARGDIRGGRFVEGFSGEQFAHPDAVGLLRNQKQSHHDKITLSAADPLNLVGIILPGDKIPAHSGHRILFDQGVPVAVQQGKKTHFLLTPSPQDEWAIRNQLIRPISAVSPDDWVN